jgi:hypothetical protein
VTVEDALEALGESPETDYPVVILHNDGGNLTAAPVLGVLLDDGNGDVSLLMGESSEDEVELAEAVSMSEVREALREAGPGRADWPMFSAAGAEEPLGGALGGSLVGYSTSAEVEIFAFLQGPKSDWDEN